MRLFVANLSDWIAFGVAMSSIGWVDFSSNDREECLSDGSTAGCKKPVKEEYPRAVEGIGETHFHIQEIGKGTQNSCLYKIESALRA